MWHSDAFRRAYLLEIARRMREDETGEIARRARALLGKWAKQEEVDPAYGRSWEQAIDEGAEGVIRIASADTSEAEALRHCMPFAGILSNRERLELRRRYSV